MKIVSILATDAYYRTRAHYIGKECYQVAGLRSNGDGSYTCSVYVVNSDCRFIRRSFIGVVLDSGVDT